MPQQRAKLAILAGRERSQHIPRVNQLLHDARDARAHLERGRQVVAPHLLARGAQFVQDQLQPQLGRLMLDDEQHLVVVAGQQFLRAQHLVERQVIAIAHVLAEVEFGLLVFRHRFAPY